MRVVSRRWWAGALIREAMRAGRPWRALGDDHDGRVNAMGRPVAMMKGTARAFPGCSLLARHGRSE
jgi:ABC-type branched-subunit amino acid transport system permease subunit